MRSLLLSGVLSAISVLPAAADPAVGLGVTFWFGQGQTQTGIGLRVFSNDEPDSLVGSVGVDYLLNGGGVRPTLGLAWLVEDWYVGLDAGLDLNGGPIQFGTGLGAANSTTPAPGAGPAPGGGEK